MYLPLGTFSPDIKLGLVSASRNCFPRALSEARTRALMDMCASQGLELLTPQGECAIIETKEHAAAAAAQLNQMQCDAAVLFLGNFSPEIEDANFVKQFNGPVMVFAAAEESAATLAGGRGDALCGLLSCMMAIRKRGLEGRVYVPQNPVMNAKQATVQIARFVQIMKVVKGARNATIGLFGPRPRDFETCNYSVAALASIGVEVEELGFFDLVREVENARAQADLHPIKDSMNREVKGIPQDEFLDRLSAYERAVLNLREQLRLSGMTSQCWSEQEMTLKHVPCFVNGRLAGRGFPIACENDAYSLVAELLGQYASDQSVTILDINHSIPADLAQDKLEGCAGEDLVGLFHCGNTHTARLKNPQMKYQLIMKRLMEPQGEADITRGTIEGQIAASPITVLQVQQAAGQDKLQAYLIEGQFLDLDPKTFGCTGTAWLPGFGRFYRHALLGRFHHHAAVAFSHCADVLYDALRLLGVEQIYTPNAADVPYAGENPFVG